MIHYLVPDFILQRHAQGEFGGQIRGTTLFLDVSGFTQITDTLMQAGQHGAEVLAAIMRSVFDPAVRAVHRQGGFISGFAGDAFTAVFQEHAEDDPNDQARAASRRALAAAWEIQQAIVSASQPTTPYGQFTLTAKIGLASGEITWGIVRSGDDTRAMYYFRGEAIDGCAQAEHLAHPGDIIVMPEMAPLVAATAVLAETMGACRVVALAGDLPAPLPAGAPEVDLEVMAQYFPRAILTQPYGGEFRHAVNVFIGLPTLRDDAQLAALMQAVFDLQKRFGGLLNRLDFGDKGANMLLFWGAPVAYESDILRALEFIHELQARSSIPIHAGITYRISHAGLIGGLWREEYTCYGRGVNLAARMMMAAPRDEIWLDEAIAGRAASYFELEPAGEHSFKGFAQKQAVFLLGERKETQDTVFHSAMVGRRRELAHLEAFAAPLWQGRSAGGIAIVGEAGLGKSRLVHAFRTSPAMEARTVLWALCQADETLRDSLNPFRYWLRGYFGQSHGQAETRNKSNFSRQLDNLLTNTGDAGLAAELDRTRSCLGALVGLRWPDSLYEQLDAEGRHENTFDGLKALIKAESRRQPVILHLEDAHWIDDESVQFLERLFRSVEASPIALVLTARPEQSTGAAGERLDGLFRALNWQRIDLAQMSREDVSLLASQVAGAPLAAEFIRHLEVRAEGNPFFAEQIVLYLKARGLLHADATGVVAVDSLPDRLPGTIQALLVARIDQLSKEVKEAVQLAAIVGREFEVQLLSHMLQAGADPSIWVSQAEQASIWAQLNALRYVFRHALLQGAAYQMQLHARRQQLHFAVAEAIATLYAGDLAPHYSALGFHYEQAGAVEPAVRYLEQAGDLAAASYQNSQAIDAYSRALALTPDPNQRLVLLLDRETVQDRLGNRDAQTQDLATAHAVAQERGDLSALAAIEVRQAALARNMGRHAEASAQADHAAALARQAGNARSEARAITQRGSIWIHTGDYGRAEPEFETAHRLAASVDDAQTVAECLYKLGHCALARQDLAEATVQYAAALASYQAQRDRRGEVNCLLMFGVVYRRQGKHEEASAAYENALKTAQDIGWKHGQAYLLGHMGNQAFDLGDLVAAGQLHRQALALCREVGDREGEALSLDTLGLVAHASGLPDEARQRYTEALAIQRAIGYRRGEGYALTHLGHVLVELGELAAAEEAYQEALAIRRALGADNPAAVDDWAGLAQVALARGDTARALEHGERVLAWLETRGTSGVESPSKAFWGVVQFFASAGQAERTVEVLRMAYDDLLKRADAIHSPALRQQFFDGDPYNRRLMAAFRDLGGRRDLATSEVF